MKLHATDECAPERAVICTLLLLYLLPLIFITREENYSRLGRKYRSNYNYKMKIAQFSIRAKSYFISTRPNEFTYLFHVIV